MNLEATIKAIDERTELISEAFAKTIFLLKDMQEENAQLKREVQELREEMNSGLSEDRLRATLKKSYEIDGYSASDAEVYFKRFINTSNGIAIRFDEVENLIKSESVKVQNASYSRGSSAVFS